MQPEQVPVSLRPAFDAAKLIKELDEQTPADVAACRQFFSADRRPLLLELEAKLQALVREQVDARFAGGIPQARGSLGDFDDGRPGLSRPG